MAFISALASVISSEDTKAAPFLCPFVCFNLRLLPKFRKRINRKFSVKKLIDIVARDETTLRHTTKPLTALIIPSRKNKENHVLNHNNNNANNNNDNNNNNHPRLYWLEIGKAPQQPMAVNLEMIPESFLPIQLAEQFDTRFDLTELLSSFVVVVDDDDERRGEEIGFCVWMFSFFPSVSLFFSFLRWKWQGYPEYIRVISRMIMPSSAISDMDSDIILRRKWTKRNQFLSRRFFPGILYWIF